MCMAMILLAMELTTKYEEEDEEQGALEEQGQGLDTLLEDQALVFDSRADIPTDIPILISTTRLVETQSNKQQNSVQEWMVS